jgi:glutaredoxin
VNTAATPAYASVGSDPSGGPRALVLYKFDGCPYCRKTMRAIEQLGITVRYRDINNDTGAWDELMRIGGKDQVPCLLVDGKPMYESEDIIVFLETHFAKSATRP